MYTNAQKLAAVLSDWVRPAAAQIVTQKVGNLPSMQNISNWLANIGIVKQGYNLGNELQPFAASIIDSIAYPILAQQLSAIPDESLPALAHGIVDTAISQGTLSFLDGLVTFEADDLNELKTLLTNNLPLSEQSETYQIIK